jgi:quaternary ammonium compound-resistance protein SugE
MGWFYLSVAGLLEIGWAIGLKYTEGFSRPWSSTWTLLAMVAASIF